jgi:SpoVK/Ycf46/Vps4 family AAA+-type ATPase
MAQLFQAISRRDFQSASEIANGIVTNEERRGNRTAAQLLKGALHSNGIRGHRMPEPISGTLQNGNFLDAALSRGHRPTRFADVMLRNVQKQALIEMLTEYRHAALLAARGVPRRSKLLFVGPPGCGKSFTAQAIANELALPHYVVRFDAVIGAYLGQTAIHLRELFRFTAENPCVLLFDEIDALGKQRGNPLDVGELDRIVIALMQELELSETRGLVIATSNLPKNLDRALWRRFDLVLKFPTPTKSELNAYAQRLARKFGVSVTSRFAKRISTAANYADAEKVVEAEARDRVLAEVGH